MANLDEVSGWLSANLSELLAKYKVPGAAVGVYSGRAGRRLRGRRAESRDRGRGHHRLGLPDRVDHQDLDRHADHAAGRRGAARHRQARRQLPARFRPRRRRGRQDDDRAAGAQPHRRLRGRHLHRHRQQRRLRREVRGDAEDRPAAVPAGRDVLLQQRRLLRPRPDRRGAAGQAVRPGAPRAPVRAAGAGARRHRRQLRDLVQGRHRAPAQPRGPGRRPGPGADLRAGQVQRPGRGDAGDAPARPARLRRHAPEQGRRRRRHPGALGRVGRRHAVGAGHAAAARPDGRPLGAELGAVRPGRRPGVRPRRRHRRAERVPADRAGRGPGDRAAHQRRQPDRAVLRALRAPAARARRGRDPRAPGAAGRTGPDRRSPFRRHLRQLGRQERDHPGR